MYEDTSIRAARHRGSRVTRSVALLAVLLAAASVSGAAQTQDIGGQVPARTKPAAGKPYTLYNDDIRVDAVLMEVEKFLDRQMHTYDLLVSRGGQKVRITTTLIGVSDDREAVSRLKDGVGRKGKYLFVREECGGGNAWRCNVDHVFMVTDERLVELGTIFANPESPRAGGGYTDGWFRDVYDKLEGNALTSHAAAPGFWIWLQEMGGRLVAHLGRTWEENRAGYAERDRRYRGWIGQRGVSGRDGETLRAMLLLNAALTRYCGKEAEGREVLKAAEQLLDADTYRSFQDELSGVVPGDLPGGPE